MVSSDKKDNSLQKLRIDIMKKIVVKLQNRNAVKPVLFF